MDEKIMKVIIELQARVDLQQALTVLLLGPLAPEVRQKLMTDFETVRLSLAENVKRNRSPLTPHDEQYLAALAVQGQKIQSLQVRAQRGDHSFH